MKETDTPVGLEFYAAFVHGALASLHLLGVLFNFRKGNKLDTAIHSVAIVYHIRSVRHHKRLYDKYKELYREHLPDLS